MRKYIKYVCGVTVLLAILACEKNDPMTELGTTNGEYAAQLRVTYNNTRPAIGDTLITTASTWQRDDKYDKVMFYETIYETFGLEFSLENGSSINTQEIEVDGVTFPAMLITDTIKNRTLIQTINASDMDSYWVTATNNYVIRNEYILERLDGDYSGDASVITRLSDVEFGVLKSLLAYNITRNDYLALFPDAPNTHFAASGNYVLNQTGIDYLKANLTREMLTPLVSNMEKRGVYSIRIEVEAITPTGTTTSTSRTFDNNI